jgi:hypothetical protein
VDDGAIVEYSWHFGVYNDPTDPNYGTDVETSTSPTAEWTYYQIGNYTVTLTIKDNGLEGVANSAKYGTDSMYVFVI